MTKTKNDLRLLITGLVIVVIARAFFQTLGMLLLYILNFSPKPLGTLLRAMTIASMDCNPVIPCRTYRQNHTGYVQQNCAHTTLIY